VKRALPAAVRATWSHRIRVVPIHDADPPRARADPPPSFLRVALAPSPPLSLSFSPCAPAGFKELSAPLFPLFRTLVRAQAHHPLHSSTTPIPPSDVGAALPTVNSRQSAAVRPFSVSAPSEPFLPQLRPPSPLPSLPTAPGPRWRRRRPLLRQGHRRMPLHRAATPPHRHRV
jgi:hypothetical protein